MDRVFFKMTVFLIACSTHAANGRASEDQNLLKAMKKLQESKFDVSLLNDEKKASINLAASKGLLRYAFNVEQRFESGTPNVTFATRDGIAAKTKATIRASYKIIDGQRGSSLPPPEIGAFKVEPDDNLNPLSSFGVIDFSVSHFRSDVSYYLLADARRISANKDGFEGGVGGSWITSEGQTRFSFGLSYQRGYERERSNKEKNICKSMTETPQFSECFNTYLAPAKKVEKIIPYLKFIDMVDNGFVTSYELSAKYISTREPDSTTEQTKNNITFEVPVHIWSLLDKKLSAGIKFAYATKPGIGEDKFSYGVFLSAPLSIY